ncbi:MAG TPA: PQQ-binding-like beta-propeller repeat protein [Thermomicrobiaceae bacterium]|nr:PQQ-binding-like beta-propeller repeat protein [Thermomicrobiaceae bacterium]
MAILTATPAASAATPGATPEGDWLRFGYDPARSGVNPAETTLTPGNVAGLHQLWRAHLPEVADSSPAFLHALPFPDGSTHDVLYVETRDGRLVALDAAEGTILWQRQPKGPKITNSSPVADAARRVVYAYGLDGALHQYQAATGQEISGNGWPVPITKLTGTEKESSAPNAAFGLLYVTTSGYLGDAPPYQGHVVAIDPASGAAQVFNSLCADKTALLGKDDCDAQRSGIWARAGAVADPVNPSIYVSTGNGPFDPAKHNWGDTVLRLSVDGTKVLDSYTPSDYQTLDERDVDLGSTAPALLPRLPGSKTPLLLVQGGKDGLLRLLNRADMSGQGGPGHVGGELQAIESAGCATFTQPVVWSASDGTVWLIVAGTCALAGYQVVTDQAGATTLELGWKSGDIGTTPVLANGVLYLATSGALLALDPATGKHLWSSAETQPRQTIGSLHWESPIVVDGRVYIADEQGGLSAYGLG